MEKDQAVKSLTNERNLLMNEVTSQKDQIVMLTKQIDALQVTVNDKQQSELLSLIPVSDQRDQGTSARDSSSVEENLVLKERIVKAEQEVERLRLQLHEKNDELSKAE